ncbi:MAG: copper transporter [Streptosporangiaceae bacterium]
MIDFRYHLVSIIAVFLALAVGLVVGSTALPGKTEEALTVAQHKAISENTALRKERNLLQQQVAGDEAFATASSERLLAGLLTGERVVLVAAPGANRAVLSGLTTALRQAGATVTGQVSLTGAFTTTTGQNEAALSGLAQSLASKAGLQLTAQSASPVSGQQAAAQVLAASLVSSSDTLASTASQEILVGFSQSGFITVDSGAPADAPAELAILVTPDGQPQQSDVLVAVAQELKSEGSATVMAGAVSSIGLPGGTAISAEISAGNAVSTVDNADTETGQILVVQALRYLLNGKPPAAYGVASAKAPSPAPIPVATPTVKPSASSSAKSHA